MKNEIMDVEFGESDEGVAYFNYRLSDGFELARLQSDCLSVILQILDGTFVFIDIPDDPEDSGDQLIELPEPTPNRKSGRLVVLQTLDSHRQSTSNEFRISRDFNDWTTGIGLLTYLAICDGGGAIPVPTIEGEGLGLEQGVPEVKIANLDFGVPGNYQEYEHRIALVEQPGELPGSWSICATKSTGVYSQIGLLVTIVSNIVASYIEYEDEEDELEGDEGDSVKLYFGEISLDDFLESDNCEESLSRVDRAAVALAKRGRLDEEHRYEASSSSIDLDEVVFAARSVLLKTLASVVKE